MDPKHRPTLRTRGLSAVQMEISQSIISLQNMYCFTYKHFSSLLFIPSIASTKKHLRSVSGMLVFVVCLFRAPVIDRCDPSGTFIVSSGQAALRHMQATCLRLLSSEPDRVHRAALRRTQPSTLRIKVRPRIDKTSNGNSTPLQRIAGYRAPLPPHLAR